MGGAADKPTHPQIHQETNQQIHPQRTKKPTRQPSSKQQSNQNLPTHSHTTEWILIDIAQQESTQSSIATLLHTMNVNSFRLEAQCYVSLCKLDEQNVFSSRTFSIALPMANKRSKTLLSS
jgi:hypothetical protein